MADGSTTPDQTRHDDSLDGALREVAEPKASTDEGERLAAVEARLFPRSQRPAALGRYRIIEELGSGGMGVVYRGHDPELDRPVAVKLLHRKAARSHSSRERLRQEARALAEISHPNVVQIFDVGIEAESIYIAMELVPGMDLAQWLETPRPWREVLMLLLEAGQGLLAAHEAGLVHRDFKPSNVLVGQDGRPRVVDFGLARTTDTASTLDGSDGGTSSSHAAGSLTRTGVAMGTPAYMAPEQHLGKQADARSDQYAFCLSVWEGIFGERPFRGASVQELVSSKEHEDPQPPAGASVPRAVVRVLLRGMHPDRGRRWPGMSALLEALRDAASPRRRLGWVAGITVVLATGTAAAVWMLPGESSDPDACAPASARLAGAWDPEREQALHATLLGSGLGYAEQTWTRLQSQLDGYADAWRLAYDEVCTARREPGTDAAALDRRMVCLNARRQELASLVDVLSSGEGLAMQNAVAAASQLRPVSSCEAPEEPVPLDEAGRSAADEIRRDLLKAESLGKVARYDEGLALAEPALERATSLDLPALRADALLTVGRIHKGKAEPERAQELLSEAALLAISLRRDEVAARAAIDLIDVHGAWRGSYEEALEWSRHAEAAIDRMGGDPGLEAMRLDSLGTLELTQGHTDEALASFERSLGLVHATFGDGHPLLAKIQSDLSDALVRGGRFDEGLAAARLALAAGQQAFGEDHPQVGIMHSRLANAWVRQGDYAKAAEHSQLAIDILAASLGRKHPNVAALMVNLAQVEQRLGDLDEAAATYERALPLMKDTANEAIVLAAMSDLARDRQDYPAALDLAQRSRALREELYGPEDTKTAIGLVVEGEALARLGRDEEAFAAFARARTITETHPLPAPAQITLTAFEGRAHLYAGRPEPAVEGLRAALAEQERLGSETIDKAEVRFYLAQALWAGGHHDEARAELRTVDEELTSLGAQGMHRRAPVEAFMRREGIERSP
ncbi:MAG: serine/threonine protein kinase [Myxococcales bacterium]|nr:serine/threonine protein kinase [Myxococcales bacterium]MCB9717965.1 serine/threonine protein kinase [Myxococcales bacterium]